MTTWESPDRASGVEEDPRTQRAAARRTSQMLGIGLSLVFVSFLVVGHSQGAISPAETSSGAYFEGAHVELTDDDNGLTLFDARNLAPGDTRTACLAVTYSGTRNDARVGLSIEASGGMAPSLDVVITRGSDGDFDACHDFEPESVIYEGALDGTGSTQDSGDIDAFVADSDGDSASFLIEVTLPENVTLDEGRTANADFVWHTKG